MDGQWTGRQYSRCCDWKWRRLQQSQSWQGKHKDGDLDADEVGGHYAYWAKHGDSNTLEKSLLWNKQTPTEVMAVGIIIWIIIRVKGIEVQ